MLMSHHFQNLPLSGFRLSPTKPSLWRAFPRLERQALREARGVALPRPLLGRAGRTGLGVSFGAGGPGPRPLGVLGLVVWRGKRPETVLRTSLFEGPAKCFSDKLLLVKSVFRQHGYKINLSTCRAKGLRSGRAPERPAGKVSWPCLHQTPQHRQLWPHTRLLGQFSVSRKKRRGKLSSLRGHTNWRHAFRWRSGPGQPPRPGG